MVDLARGRRIDVVLIGVPEPGLWISEGAELYARVAEGKERRAEVLRIAKESYPRIAEITQRAVDFNDKYDRSEDDPASGALEADLSRLGEELAVRFELEDQLFRALLTRK